MENFDKVRYGIIAALVVVAITGTILIILEAGAEESLASMNDIPTEFVE